MDFRFFTYEILHLSYTYFYEYKYVFLPRKWLRKTHVICMENRIPILRHVYIYTNVICFLGLLVSSSINNFLKTNSHNFYFFIFSHKNVRVQDQEVLSFIIQGLLKYLPTHYSHYKYNTIAFFVLVRVEVIKRINVKDPYPVVRAYPIVRIERSWRFIRRILFKFQELIVEL